MLEELYRYYYSDLTLQSHISVKTRLFINAGLCLIFILTAGFICIASYYTFYKNLIGMFSSIFLAGLSLYGGYMLVTYFVVKELKKYKKLKVFCVSRFSFSYNQFDSWRVRKLRKKIKSLGVVSNEQVDTLLNRTDQLAKDERISIITNASIATVIIVPVWSSYIDKAMELAKDNFNILTLMFFLLLLLGGAIYIVVKMLYQFSDRVLTRRNRIIQFRAFLAKVHFAE